MSVSVAFEVNGVPAPQGSKRAFRNPASGRIQQVESSKKVKPWRQDVQAAAEAAAGEHWRTLDEPTRLVLVFYMPRPKGHYGTGRNAGTLRDSAPLRPAGVPDVDKLARSTMDALRNAGIYRDDARVVELIAFKLYADDRLPGAYVQAGPIARANRIRPADVTPETARQGGLF